MASHGDYTFYCPHCRHKLTSRLTQNLYQEGCPLLYCSKCGESCLDAFTSEPAFKPFAPESTIRFVLRNIFPAALISFFACMALVLILPPGTIKLEMVMIAVFAVSWLLLFLKDKANRNRILLEKWEASDQRLRNFPYAEELANFGFKVPKQYLPADFKLRPSTVPHQAALIRKPSCLDKFPGPRADRIDVWHPERD